MQTDSMRNALPGTVPTPHDRVALITGAGSGIGRATARVVLADGWRVVLAGRRLEPQHEAIALAEDPFGDIHLRALAASADVTRPDAVADLFTQHAFRMMKQQLPRGGRIINNGSISAHAPRPHSAACTATKHANTGLTKAAALDGRQHDIAVGQIDIGNAASDMAAQMAAGMPQADGSVRAEPLMDVRHAARAVLQMASLPLDANVLFMTVMATRMPFVGRG